LRNPLEAILQRTDHAPNAGVHDNCGLSCPVWAGTSAVAGLGAAMSVDPSNADTYLSLLHVLIPERRAR
jgi:hypothetical protein